MYAKALDALEGRQREVAILLARGLGYTEAGRELGLNNSTVRGHAGRAFRTLGVTSLLELRQLFGGKPPLPKPEDFDRHRLLRRLTMHERTLALLLVEGYTNPDLAKRFCVSPQTIATHRSRIYLKLDVRSVAELESVLRHSDENDDFTARTMDEVARYLATVRLADSIGIHRASSVVKNGWDQDSFWDIRVRYEDEAKSLVRFLGIAVATETRPSRTSEPGIAAQVGNGKQ